MSQRHVQIVSWNVNGIRAAEKKGFVDWLLACNADVVGLQETKASSEQLSLALREPSGYHAEWCSAEKKGYSGVATYSRQAPLSVSRGLCDTRFDADGRVLITSFPEFTFYNIYFPNGGRGPEWVSHKIAFYGRFVELVAEQIRAGTPVVVAGDVNTAYAEIDLARPRENAKTSGFMPEEREAMGLFFGAGLVDTFRHLKPDDVKYSWWDQRTGARARGIGWRLDYIFVSPDLLPFVSAAEIHSEVLGSDHCPVSLTLSFPIHE